MWHACTRTNCCGRVCVLIRTRKGTSTPINLPSKNKVMTSNHRYFSWSDNSRPSLPQTHSITAVWKKFLEASKCCSVNKCQTGTNMWLHLTLYSNDVASHRMWMIPLCTFSSWRENSEWTSNMLAQIPFSFHFEACVCIISVAMDWKRATRFLNHISSRVTYCTHMQVQTRTPLPPIYSLKPKVKKRTFQINALISIHST